MRLLVTRPEPDAARTAAKLSALGHEVLVQPLLTIAFTSPPDDVPTPGGILVTSQNAVRALERWPQSRDWRDVPVFPAGPATARSLAAAGFRDVRTGARDAGSLADVVLGTFPPNQGPLLYPAARDRAGALAGGLMARGYDVRAIEAYRADPVAALNREVRDALERRAVDGVLLYSARTARVLMGLAEREGISGALEAPVFFVISRHVAEVVGARGAGVRIAERPDEDSLLALIPAVG